MAVIGVAEFLVTANTKAFVAQLEGLQASVRSIGVAFGAAFAGVEIIKGLEGATKGAAAFAEQVRQVTQFTGASAKSSSQFVVGLQAIGLSAEGLGPRFLILSRNIEQGQKQFTRFFNVAQLESLKSGDLIKVIGTLRERYKELGTEQEKNTFLQTTFGRGAANLKRLMEDQNGEFTKAAAAAHQFGLELTDANIEGFRKFQIDVKELGLAFKGIEVQLGVAFLPILTRLVEGLTQAVEKFQELSRGTKVAIAAVAIGIPVFSAFAIVAGAVVRGVASIAGAFQGVKVPVVEAISEIELAATEVNVAMATIGANLATTLATMQAEFDTAMATLAGTSEAVMTEALAATTAAAEADTAILQAFLVDALAADNAALLAFLTGAAEAETAALATAAAAATGFKAAQAAAIAEASGAATVAAEGATASAAVAGGAIATLGGSVLGFVGIVIAAGVVLDKVLLKPLAEVGHQINDFFENIINPGVKDAESKLIDLESKHEAAGGLKPSDPRSTFQKPQLEAAAHNAAEMDNLRRNIDLVVAAERNLGPTSEAAAKALRLIATGHVEAARAIIGHVTNIEKLQSVLSTLQQTTVEGITLQGISARIQGAALLQTQNALAAQDLNAALKNVPAGSEAATNALATYAKALFDARKAAADANGNIDVLTGKQFDEATALEAATEAAINYRQEVDKVTEAHIRLQRAIEDAELAVNKAEIALQRATEDATKRTRDSLRDRADAYREQARAIADADAKVADTILKGQRKIRDDQEKLSDARKDDARKRRDEVNQLKRDEKSRSNSIVDAFIAIERAQAEGNAHAENQASLDLARAQQDKTTADQKRKIQEDDADRATAIARLQRSLAEDTIDVGKEVARAKEDQRRTIEDENEKVVKSEERVSQAAQQNARDINDARRALTAAMRDGANSVADAKKALDALNPVVGNLAELLRLAKDQAHGLADAFRDVASAFPDTSDLFVLNNLIGPVGPQGPKGRRFGGPFDAGVPFFAGEAGTELIIPGSSGTVVSNAQILDALRSLSGTSRSGGTNITVNEVANDPQATAMAVSARLIQGVDG